MMYLTVFTEITSYNKPTFSTLTNKDIFRLSLFVSQHYNSELAFLNLQMTWTTLEDQKN